MQFRRTVIALLTLATFGTPATAEGEKAGAFDYYVLALSWSPNWCLREGDARGAPECAEGAARGWGLHGLWPQNERGWPSFCRTNARSPSRSDTAAETDIYGSSGLAWHQWKKHGTCSGLSSAAYYDLAREAYSAVTRPVVFRALDQDIRLPAGVVEEAFLKSNPDLDPDMITVTCKANQIQEVRICLTKDLIPRRCGTDVIRDCTADRALFTPLR
ncbi:ribonuclease T2 family protein [Tropicimonas sp. S265A]|uniref:ribonuclease T2 family protein n=1 Tax=Tropicimonas sp. S265A TaxID=3415134 RepID=UPI003C7E531C